MRRSLAAALLLVPSAEVENELSEGLGAVAAWMLGITIVLALWNLARRRYVLKALRGKGGAIKRLMWWHRKVAIPLHAVAGVLALGTGTVHGLGAGSQHWTLWLAIAIMGFLSLGGALLLWKWPPAKVRKGVYVLHSQQGLLVALLVLLFVGHAIVG